MSESRRSDYLDHMQQAAADACSFVEGLGRADFLPGATARNRGLPPVFLSQFKRF